MINTNEETTPPEVLSDTLTQRIDALELPGLKAVRSYVERRIESIQTPIDAEIEANAAGEVLEIENHGAYALVRKHPPDPDGPGVNTEITSLYHVRREPQSDGTESLRWAYLGDVHDTAEARCEPRGRTFDREVGVRPDRGSDDIDSETEE